MSDAHMRPEFNLFDVLAPQRWLMFNIYIYFNALYDHWLKCCESGDVLCW